MGGIRDDFGRICIETDRDGFTIHASYGFVPKRVEIGTLRPGDEFFLDGRKMKLSALYELSAEATDAQFSAVTTFDNLEKLVEVDDQDFDETAPLARLWNEYPHPVFAVEDLNDLIAALKDVKEHYGAR